MEVVMESFFIIIGAYVFIVAYKFPYRGFTYMSPGLVPMVVSALFIILNCFSIIENVKIAKQNNPKESSKIFNIQFTITSLATIFYYLSIYKFGYIVSTLIYFFLLSVYLGQSKIKGSVYSIIITTIIVVIFQKIFHVPLPNISFWGVN